MKKIISALFVTGLFSFPSIAHEHNNTTDKIVKNESEFNLYKQGSSINFMDCKTPSGGGSVLVGNLSPVHKGYAKTELKHKIVVKETNGQKIVESYLVDKNGKEYRITEYGPPVASSWTCQTEEVLSKPIEKKCEHKTETKKHIHNHKEGGKHHHGPH